ncbi:MAG: NADH-quinone oxidoreductase subunit C [Patescibacteria group bacterium]
MKKFDNYLPKNVSAQIDGDVASFEVSVDEITEIVRNLHVDKNLTLKLIDVTDERAESGCFKVWYVFGAPEDGLFIAPYIRLEKTEEFPSVTSVIHAAGNYERKIKTFFGLTPIGNPDSRMLILHENWPDDVFPLRKEFDAHKRPAAATGIYKFQRVHGEGIYEIPVGPIHAGIIEPGHFRFSVAGESIMLLEARLGYVHKGHEKLFESLNLTDQVRLSQKVSGDSSLSHSLAFCQAVEQLSGIDVPERAKYLRTIYAELERLACHFGDIGFMMMDTGFNFGGANGSRLREMIMRINERLTESRFLRGVNVVGGVAKDISDEQNELLIQELDAIMKDFKEVVDIAENRVSVLNRLKGTGPLPYDVAKDHGAVGVPARAVGVATDARAEYPYAAYGELPLGDIPTEKTGDVYARFRIRIREARTASKLIQEALTRLPKGPIAAKTTKSMLKKSAIAIGCVEGWRGEIIYFIKTDKQGQINRVAIRDPSFINWQVLGYCGQGQIVPDFPLINKSFNLSYTGHDL